MIVYFEGADISEEISVSRCWHETHAQGRADSLMLEMNDKRRLWDKWRPQIGDSIEVREGAARSGRMFLHSILPRDGLYALFAMALPVAALEKRTNTWENAWLMQIAGEIAGRYGMEMETYGVTNRQYAYIAQKDERDFGLLHRLLLLESCAFLIYDRKIILYSIPYMEAQPAAMTLELDAASEYRLYEGESPLYARCEIRTGDYSGEYRADEMSTGLVYRPGHDIRAGSGPEAQRFARGLLRAANQDYREIVIWRELTSAIAPGSMVNIRVRANPSWDGDYFVRDIRHYYTENKSKISLRWRLEGY